MTRPPRLRVIGPGRAGGSLMVALDGAGWDVASPLGRAEDLSAALVDTDLLVVAVPDAAIASVAQAVEPVAPDELVDGSPVIAHVAGSLGLAVLWPHRRVGAMHPLVSLPSAEIGGARLGDGQWFGVAGHPIVERAVADLGGRAFHVADADRTAYHAAAAMASNHLVALLGQVERVAASIGVPAEAYLGLAAGSVDNVAALGSATALTGPVARGDWATVANHLDAIDASEHAAYRALAAAARRLVDGQGLPPDL